MPFKPTPTDRDQLELAFRTLWLVQSRASNEPLGFEDMCLADAAARTIGDHLGIDVDDLPDTGSTLLTR